MKNPFRSLVNLIIKGFAARGKAEGYVLTDRDRDTFLKNINSSPKPNEALRALFLEGIDNRPLTKCDWCGNAERIIGRSWGSIVLLHCTQCSHEWQAVLKGK